MGKYIITSTVLLFFVAGCTGSLFEARPRTPLRPAITDVHNASLSILRQEYPATIPLREPPGEQSGAKLEALREPPGQRIETERTALRESPGQRFENERKTLREPPGQKFEREKKALREPPGQKFKKAKETLREPPSRGIGRDKWAGRSDDHDPDDDGDDD